MPISPQRQGRAHGHQVDHSSARGSIAPVGHQTREPLRGVAAYRDIYKLTYVRGPSGIIVMLAEELNKDPT